MQTRGECNIRPFIFYTKTKDMKQIHDNLFIGNDIDCRAAICNSEFAIIHACKTCHQKKLGYEKSLPANHEHYLIYENDSHLFLNMVDMPNEFRAEFTNPMFARAMDFIRRAAPRKVLVHCNQGLSRSPSLGMMWLVINGVIAKDSQCSAVADFLKIYPDYAPGNGIKLYMQNNWDYLIRMAL